MINVNVETARRDLFVIHDTFHQARNQGGAGWAKPPLKIFRPTWKNVLDKVQIYWTQCKKFEPLSKNSSPPLVPQAGYGPAFQSK